MSSGHIAGDETSGFPSRTLPCCANRISLNKNDLDDFIDWLRGSKCIRQDYLNALPKVVCRPAQKVGSLAQLSEQELRAARNYYRSTNQMSIAQYGHPELNDSVNSGILDAIIKWTGK